MNTMQTHQWQSCLKQTQKSRNTCWWVIITTCPLSTYCLHSLTMDHPYALGNIPAHAQYTVPQGMGLSESDLWPALTADQVHTQTCGLHVSQVIVCSYVTNGLPWWQECMLGWGVEGEGVSMKCCTIWLSSSWRNGWSPDRVIHIWIKMFVCLYAGRCKLQVSVWPRNLTFGLILITHCHWDMRKMLCSLQ